jgi:hypothetical protein
VVKKNRFDRRAAKNEIARRFAATKITQSW